MMLSSDLLRSRATRRRFLSVGTRLVGSACASALLLPGHGRSATPAVLDDELLARALEQAQATPRLRSLIVVQEGDTRIERRLNGGPPLDRPVNVKSVAKTVIATLVGIAIDSGILEGVDQPIAPLLKDKLPRDPDPRLGRVTIGHLLAMRAGLERTSGPFYGRWVNSRDWVRYALSRPFVDEPGGSMLYSTGNSHLLSAILTRVTGRSTLALARDWLGDPLGIQIPPWPRDPQGIYFGGNDMLLSPRALVRLGELYRRGGEIDGRRILSETWVQRSWTPQVRSPFTGDGYGYGWFTAEARGHPVHYAVGFGGQILHVVPNLALTVAMTSDPTQAAGPDGYTRSLHALLADVIVPACGG